MKQLSLLVLSLAVVAAACGDKKKAAPVGPTPPPGEGKVAPPKINDPAVVCRGGENGRTVFLPEFEFPAGCGPIPSEYGGQIHDLEITVEGAPVKAYIAEPVDLAMRSVAFEPNGCGVAIVYVGSIGTLELELAALAYGDNAIGGTARWTPTGGAACDLKVTGRFSDYGNDTDDE
jgi:hypothetical protein